MGLPQYPIYASYIFSQLRGVGSNCLTKIRNIYFFRINLHPEVSTGGVAQRRVHTDRWWLLLRLSSKHQPAASRPRKRRRRLCSRRLFSAPCNKCTVPSRPLSPFLLLLLLPISSLLTLTFHQSESSRCNSNTCCTPVECQAR